MYLRLPCCARVTCQLRILSVVTDVMTNRAVNDSSSERLGSANTSDSYASSVVLGEGFVVL